MGISRHSGIWLAPIDSLEAVGCVTSRADVHGCCGGGQIVAGDSQADRRVAFGDQQPSNPNAPSGIAERTIAAELSLAGDASLSARRPHPGFYSPSVPPPSSDGERITQARTHPTSRRSHFPLPPT